MLWFLQQVRSFDFNNFRSKFESLLNSGVEFISNVGYEHEIPLIKPTLDGEEYSGNNIPQNYWGIFATENTALVFIGADSVPMTSYLDLQVH